MRTLVSVVVLFFLGSAACGPRSPSRTGGDAFRALPPERTNADEWDGPTAPREGANRPPNQGAGYEDSRKVER